VNAALGSSTIFLGENNGIEEIVGFFKAFVSEPEDIEAGFVAIVKQIKNWTYPLFSYVIHETLHTVSTPACFLTVWRIGVI